MAYTAQNKAPEINASSMADIAFLLLIFFLVTTTIDSDKGLLLTLPRLVDQPVETQPIHPSNLMELHLNHQSALMMNGEVIPVQNLKSEVLAFVLNEEQRNDRPSSPTKAVISLQSSKFAAYQSYIDIHNEIRAAYNELWDKSALKQYQVHFNQLKTIDQKRAIRKQFPFRLSESEPEL